MREWEIRSGIPGHGTSRNFFRSDPGIREKSGNFLKLLKNVKIRFICMKKWKNNDKSFWCYTNRFRAAFDFTKSISLLLPIEVLPPAYSFSIFRISNAKLTQHFQKNDKTNVICNKNVVWKKEMLIPGFPDKNSGIRSDPGFPEKPSGNRDTGSGNPHSPDPNWYLPTILYFSV